MKNKLNSQLDTKQLEIWHVNCAQKTKHSIIDASVILAVVHTTFRVSRRRCEMYIGHVCLSVCLILATFPHYCMDPDVTWRMVGGAPSCALLGGLAICAWVSLL